MLFWFLIAYVLSSNLVYASILSYLFVINLIILESIKRIQCEIILLQLIKPFTNIVCFTKIEDESFKSEKLVALQQN
jgi:hypothetical protein